MQLVLTLQDLIWYLLLFTAVVRTSWERRRKCCLCDGLTAGATKRSGYPIWRNTLTCTDSIQSSGTHKHNKLNADRTQETGRLIWSTSTDMIGATRERISFTLHLLLLHSYDKHGKKMVVRCSKWLQSHHGRKLETRNEVPKRHFPACGSLTTNSFAPLLSQKPVKAVSWLHWYMRKQSAWMCTGSVTAGGTARHKWHNTEP